MVAKVGADVCERLIAAATSHCAVTQAPAVVPAQPASASLPDWGGVTTGLTSLSTAFVLGSIIVALLAVIGGLAWGVVVTRMAEKEAQKAAREAAKEFINAWLTNEAPGVVREHVEFLSNFGSGGSHATSPADNAADTIGEAAG